MAKHILVVDDVIDWQKTLAGLLEDEGYEVTPVGDPRSALGAVEESHFDLAVIDIRLDETNEDDEAGLGLAGMLKQKQIDLPVIIITGYETPQAIDRAMKPDAEGQRLAEDFVLKVDAEELVKVVKQTVGSPAS